MTTPNCTIAWDATELDGNHVNEVHVAAPKLDGTRSYYTLSVASLAGGTTHDYITHIQESLEDLAQMYS